LFASTGVIGEKFPLLKIKYSIDKLMERSVKPNKFEWIAAANAIMTTDTIAKMAYESFDVNNKKLIFQELQKDLAWSFLTWELCLVLYLQMQTFPPLF